MRLSEVPVGERVILRENMDGETGMIRETHYVRVGGDARYPSNVNVARVRCIQGVPGERPRWDTGEYHAWSEASGAIQVEPVSTGVLTLPIIHPPETVTDVGPKPTTVVQVPDGEMAGELVIIIPYEIEEMLDLQPGQLVYARVEDGKIIISLTKETGNG